MNQWIRDLVNQIYIFSNSALQFIVALRPPAPNKF